MINGLHGKNAQCKLNIKNRLTIKRGFYKIGACVRTATQITDMETLAMKEKKISTSTIAIIALMAAET